MPVSCATPNQGSGRQIPGKSPKQPKRKVRGRHSWPRTCQRRASAARLLPFLLPNRIRVEARDVLGSSRNSQGKSGGREHTAVLAPDSVCCSCSTRLLATPRTASQQGRRGQRLTDVEWTKQQQSGQGYKLIRLRSGVLHHEPSPRVCISIHPEGQTCSVRRSRRCSQ